MKAFVIDMGLCVGCYCCQIACKDEHCDNDWTPYAKPQPETGQFWGKLNEYVRGQVPQVKVNWVFVPCQHCENATCIDACPQSAIVRRNDGIVIIDPKLCTGCMNCLDASACPYGSIYFNQGLHIAQKCTGCAHLLDRNEVFAPRCADACTNFAIIFGDESELDFSGTETLHPEYGLTTRVHYKNLPKRFIAGTVYNPSTEEVIIGATCTLSGVSSGTVTTDNFGDFWFEGLQKGSHSLKIEYGGKSKTIDVNTMEKDISLGDVALS